MEISRKNGGTGEDKRLMFMAFHQSFCKSCVIEDTLEEMRKQQSNCSVEGSRRESEKILFDLAFSSVCAHEEHTELKTRSKSLEESCRLLENEKVSLVSEVETSQDNPLEIFISQKFIHELLLRMRVQDQKEESLVNEIDSLKRMISELQSVSQNLEEEGRFSKNEFLALKEEIRTLEGEIFLVLGETLSSSTLSLILNNIINERSTELKVEGVNGVSGDKLEEADFESLHRREVLNYEIANAKTVLSQKELELSEVAKKLVATEIEKSALEKVVADLKLDLEEVQMIRHEREMQILKLSEKATKKFSRKKILGKGGFIQRNNRNTVF